MEKYIKTVNKFNRIGEKINRSAMRRIGPEIQQAGIDFLAQIHAECKNIGATDAELYEEQKMLEEQRSSESVKKPELTLEYLKSIGREDIASW